jgi:hypothetical protein
MMNPATGGKEAIMKVVWYLLTVVFGLFGALSLLRAGELLLLGAVRPFQFVFAIGMISLAFICLKRARTA